MLNAAGGGLRTHHGGVVERYLALYRQALQSGITLAPGYLFSATPRYSNFVRLNAAYMSFAAEKSLERLGELVKRLL